jgi:regulatory protein
VLGRTNGEHRVPGDDERLQQALEFAHRYLNRCERTVSEVRGQLGRHAVDATTAAGAIEILLDAGYLDDARYARLFAEDKRELEQWGADRIRRTLLGRGIEHELIEDVLSRPGSEGELERALALLRRRFPSPPQDRRERDRALGVLLRKGYDGELALDALSVHARETDGAGRPSAR